MLLQRMTASRTAGLPWGDGAHRRAAPANGSSVTQHYHRGPVRAALRTNGSSGEAAKHYIVQASGGYGPSVRNTGWITPVQTQLAMRRPRRIVTPPSVSISWDRIS